VPPSRRTLAGHITPVVAFMVPDLPSPAVKPEKVGRMDAGLGSDLSFSNRAKPTEAPKFYREVETRLRRVERVLSQRKPVSNGIVATLLTPSLHLPGHHFATKYWAHLQRKAIKLTLLEAR
jgi:hypothetical protein